MYDASDKRHVKQAQKLAKIAERDRQAEIRSQMSTTQGRRYMYENLVACHVFESCFNTNALTMAYMEGERNIGCKLLFDIMQACPDQYVVMTREANERELARDNSVDRRNGQERSDDSDFGAGGEWLGHGPDPRQPAAGDD